MELRDVALKFSRFLFLPNWLRFFLNWLLCLLDWLLFFLNWLLCLLNWLLFLLTCNWLLCLFDWLLFLLNWPAVSYAHSRFMYTLRDTHKLGVSCLPLIYRIC